MSRPPYPTSKSRDAFGTWLRRELIKRRWSQSELARRMAVSRNVISTWINGRSYPSLMFLEELARVLHMTKEDILPPLPAQALPEQPIEPGATIRITVDVSPVVAIDIIRLVAARH